MNRQVIQEFRGPNRMRGQLLSGLWMLLLGVIIGCVMTLLYTGTRAGGSTDIGAGIRELVRERPPRVATNAPDAPAPRVKNPLDYYKTLPQVQATTSTTVDQRRIERQPPEPAEPAPAQRTSIVTTEPRAEVTTRTYYMLQVTSVKDFAAADALKARLALQGMESSIQQARVDGGAPNYRVRVGPFHSVNQMNDTKSRLRTLGMDPLPIKMPGKG